MDHKRCDDIIKTRLMEFVRNLSADDFVNFVGVITSILGLQKHQNMSMWQSSLLKFNGIDNCDNYMKGEKLQNVYEK